MSELDQKHTEPSKHHRRKPFGLDDEEYAAALALCALGDDEHSITGEGQ
ncbi:hypothetical protein [Streptomyces sp. NPDC058758]